MVKSKILFMLSLSVVFIDTQIQTTPSCIVHCTIVNLLGNQFNLVLFSTFFYLSKLSMT